MAWFRRSAAGPGSPRLADRVLASGCARVAVLGLHPGAGSATVLAALAAGLLGDGRAPGVTSAAGGARDDDPTAWPGERTRLPVGVVAATARWTLAESGARVAPLDTDAGDESVAIVRVVEEGPIVLHGPEDGARMASVLDRLSEVTSAPVCVTGRWERRAFAAPGRVDGWILAVGAALSAEPARVAAAVRHHAELTGLPACDAHDRLAWEVATSRNEIVLLGESGAVHDSVPLAPEAVPRALRRVGPERVRGLIHPGMLRDDLAQELVREDWRGSVVVRDATRVQIAPVYYRAWLKDGGTLRVLRPMRLVAVTVNPINPVGEDADPSAFREEIATALPEVPVHDVVLEDPDSGSRPGWRLWSR